MYPQVAGSYEVEGVGVSVAYFDGGRVEAAQHDLLARKTPANMAASAACFLVFC